jgi:hypothetical protein
MTTDKEKARAKRRTPLKHAGGAGRKSETGMRLTHALYTRVDPEIVSRLARVLEHYATTQHIWISGADLVRKLLIDGLEKYEHDHGL